MHSPTAAKSNGSGGATAAAPSAPAQPAPYSDGYPDDLWHPAATAAAPTKGGGPAPATPGPASTGTAPAAATAQDYSGFGERLRRQPAQRPALSKPLLVGPYYQPTGWFDASQGQAARFLSVYNEYKNAKDVTRQRIYLETMEGILSRSNKVIIEGGQNGSGVVPYLPLPEIQKRATTTSP